jgi:putative transposase
MSEAEIHWRTFLQSLVSRGMSGIRLIISDDHSGLKAARRAVFGGVPWQRCQFHLQQNAGSHVPRQSMKAEVAADIRKIFYAPDRPTAEMYLAQIVQKYAKSASKLADWLEKNIPEGLTVLAFPVAHQHKLRTTNMVERLNREIHRRTRVATIFPNEKSCLRLISAFLVERDEEWQVLDRVYLSFQAEDG